MKKRILSIWLSVCMVLTMLPISAMAAEIDASIGTSGEIIAFAPLDETEKSVSTGTAIEDLGLPESLTATVRTAVTANSGTSEEPVQDSGELEEAVTPDNPAAATTSSALQVDVNEQQEATAPKWEEKTVEIPVAWTSEPKYGMDAEGVYVFTPVAAGYTVSADLPEITVTVGMQPLMMALRTGTPATYGDFSVSIDEGGAAPTFDGSNNTLTFGTAGEYTVGMADGKSSTSHRILVSASGVTLNLNGVTIEVPAASAAAQDGATALTVPSGTVTLNVIANSSLTGGMGNSNFMAGGKGGTGISGNIAVMGTATLTVTGGAGGSLGSGGQGGAGISGNVTVTGAATLNATGGEAGSTDWGTGGQGGDGISGGVTVTGAATLTATGGTGGAGTTNGIGGTGIRGNLTVTDSATVSAVGGASASEFGTPVNALGSTLTAIGFVIKGGFTGSTDVITSDDTRLNQYRYITVEPDSPPPAAEPLYTVAVDTPLKIEALPIYGNPPVDEMFLPSHGFTQPTDGSKTADLYWDSGRTTPITYGETNYPITSTLQNTIYFYAKNPGTYTFTATFIDDSGITNNYIINVTVTAYTGVTDAQAVAAAKTVLVDGSVDVAFGASQADKTAAVQAYVNALLTGDAAGVTATVTFNSSTGKYDVAIFKGSVNDSKSLSMTVNVAPDPDIAIVAAAKTAAQNASYADMTQAAATDEAAIQAALKSTAETAINNSNITVTINKVSYIAPIAGTSANPGGTDGSYTFTVTVSKGNQSETTVQKTITITATPYTGITDAQAVAAAKTVLVDGSVDVAFGASQADKTAAVQAYVNALLTGDAAGVTATVTFNSSTGKYDVAIFKGSVNDSKSLSMTVNVAPDPDIAIVAAAKTAAQNASYADMTQAAATDEAAIQAALKSTAETAINNSNITVTINKVSYIAPIAGTSANPGGTDGSYTFTVTVSKGNQSETTVQKTITITATPYTGITDAQAVAAAKTVLVDGSVDVAFGASQADKTAAVQAYVNALLTGDAAGVTATVTFNSSTGKYDVAIFKGSVNDSKSLSMTVNVAPDPDIAIVAAAKTAAQNASYADMTQAAATDEAAIQAALKSTAETAINNSNITVTINKVSYIAPIAGTSANPGGTDGSYTFTVTVSKGNQSETTVQKTITITATPYTGITDAQAVAAAKTVLVDGSVDVAFGASQADKTAAVQAYVNALLTGDAAGVTATVTFNSSTGKYDVAIFKGSVNDSKSLSMTVNVAPDPDIAIVAAAKTAAQNASYADMTQAAATDEAAIQAALKSTAETAINNSNITVTINKVSYIAPIAGTSANPGGTDGSYTFTVTVSKGNQSETTVQKTITITATPYTGITDAQAVAAAKTVLVDGSVDVAFGASQADKTAAVQAYVNALLTGDAAGVTATVTFNSSTGKYDVAIFKGSVNDSKSLSMTVNVAPDPDIAIVAAAKTAAQNASYADMTQAAATDEAAIQAALKYTAETAINNSDITVTINKVSYIAPISGTSANPNGTNGSYTFTITVSKGSQSETTEQKTIIITATAYTGGSSGNGNNGSGSGNGSNTPTPSTKPTEPVTGSTENKATVDNKGNASVNLTDKNITDAIADAKAGAVKKGVNAGDITAVIHVTTGGKDANTITVNLPKTTQEQVIGNKISSVQLVIDRPDLTIGIDLAAVTEINRQANADVQLSATRMDNTKLSGDAKAAIGNRPTYDLKALYGSGKSVTDFGKGSVSVEIPYTLQKGEIAGNVYAVYVDAKGKVTYLTDSSYDANRGTVVFSTSHFSTYGIAYKANFNFTDLGGHWAKDDILFVANRGLMTGTSVTTFSPNGSMTRGMFVTALGRLANADTSAYKQSSFIDVKADAYYMGYIEWGVKNSILVGIGGGKFGPDGLVTREQMAVIMDRYATAIGFKLPEVHTQNVFADNAKIGAWAAPSVKRIQMAGIIQGKNNNFYDPQGTATRAEVSAVLRRFVELAIFSDTAQG